MDFLSVVPPVVIRPLQLLVDEIVTGERVDHARDRWNGVVDVIPTLVRLNTTPQTGPRHCEGPMVADHIVRIFAVIDVIVAGATLKDAEDVAGDSVMTLALFDAEDAVRHAPDVFRAYAVMHSVPKADRLLLVSRPDSMGEREGFVRSAGRASEYTSVSELVRYDKFRRAYDGDGASWWKASGIEAVYDDADRAIVAPQYAEIRRLIVAHFGLENAYEKFLVELCWSHDDVEKFFLTAGNDDAFLTFSERAGKAGLNVDRFLDALLGIALVDHVLGRVSMVGDRSRADLGAFHRFVSAEHAAMPERFLAREARQNHVRKLRVKTILEECGLSPAVIFMKLGTPIGPERGVVMERIYDVIRGASTAEIFGVHAEEIRVATKRAQEMLAEQGLSV